MSSRAVRFHVAYREGTAARFYQKYYSSSRACERGVATLERDHAVVFIAGSPPFTLDTGRKARAERQGDARSASSRSVPAMTQDFGDVVLRNVVTPPRCSSPPRGAVARQ